VTDIQKLIHLTNILNVSPTRRLGKLTVKLEWQPKDIFVYLTVCDGDQTFILTFSYRTDPEEILRVFLDDDFILRFYAYKKGCPFCEWSYDWNTKRCRVCGHTLQEMVEEWKRRLGI